MMALGTVCVAQMAGKTHDGHLNPSWMAVWGIVESPVVGCAAKFSTRRHLTRY